MRQGLRTRVYEGAGPPHASTGGPPGAGGPHGGPHVCIRSGGTEATQEGLVRRLVVALAGGGAGWS